jgi:hypothetical protein
MDKINDELKRCMNCGMSLTGKFCSNCGQRSDVSRITLHDFFGSSIEEALKINSGFLHTVLMLTIKPWAVIRDYVHGHRVSYTPPISILCVLLIYYALFSSAIGMGDPLIKVNFTSDNAMNSSHIAKFLCYIFTSQIGINVIMAIPVSIATYVTYFKFGSRRYNAGEYLVATVYMIDTFIIYNSIALLLRWLINDDIFSVVQLVVCVVVLIISLSKAFKVKNLLIRLVLMIADLGLIYALLYLYIMIISAVIQFAVDYLY